MEGVRLSKGRPPAGRRYHCARRFVNLGFLDRERRDVWRLLASFFARSFDTFAGIAQLVEHNLAKVGVAGSNPVSRFFSSESASSLHQRAPACGQCRAGSFFSARVAKSVDARDLKSLGINSHAGSIPAPSIKSLSGFKRRYLRVSHQAVLTPATDR